MPTPGRVQNQALIPTRTNYAFQSMDTDLMFFVIMVNYNEITPLRNRPIVGKK